MWDGRRLFVRVLPAPEAWTGLGLAPSQDSSQQTVTTSILQIRNIKLREAACQGMQLKKGSGQDPPCSQPLSATPPGLSTEQGLKHGQPSALLLHQLSPKPCLVLTATGCMRYSVSKSCSFGENYTLVSSQISSSFSYPTVRLRGRL